MHVHPRKGAVAEVCVLAADEQEIGDVLLHLREVRRVDAVTGPGREAVEKRPRLHRGGRVDAVRANIGGAGLFLHPRLGTITWVDKTVGRNAAFAQLEL